MRPQAAAASCALADGVVALPGGFALLEASRTLLCADAHLGYEEVMGGGAALPLWSTAEIVASIGLAARKHHAREIVFLGDAIHASTMSEGAARAVRAAFDGLRASADVTIVAGNHEGRTRGRRIVGETVERCERDGWMLVHGDKPEAGAARSIIGHLHPSVHLGGDRTVPAFLASASLVVIPALTPYSPGLDVLSASCLEALAPWDVASRDVHVVAVTDASVFPFGTLSRLRGALHVPSPFQETRRRSVLRPDAAPKNSPDGEESR